jgi:hypothetical protein
MHPNTLTRWEYKGKIYVKDIRKIHVVSERGSGSEKNNSGSTFLPERMMSTHVWLAFYSAYSRLELRL